MTTTPTITPELVREEWEAMQAEPRAQAFASNKRFANDQPYVAAYAFALLEDEPLPTRELGVQIAELFDRVYTRARGGTAVQVGEADMMRGATETDAELGPVADAEPELTMRRLLHNAGFAAPALVLQVWELIIDLEHNDAQLRGTLTPLLPVTFGIAKAYERAAGLAGEGNALQSLASVIEARTGQPLKVGRNDPCPCGSGRKFKKCCALVEPPPPPPKARGEELFEQHLRDVDRVWTFLCDFGPHPDAEWLRDYLKEFEEEYRPGDDDGIPDSIYVPWAAFDLILPTSKKTVAELFLERKGGRLDDAERTRLEQICRSYPSFYELIEPPSSEDIVTLRELGTDQRWRVFVCDGVEPGADTPHDLWFCRLVGTPDDAVAFTPPLVFSSEAQADFELLVKQLIEPAIKGGEMAPPDALRWTMKREGEMLAQYFLDAVEETDHSGCGHDHDHDHDHDSSDDSGEHEH